jgi:general secretion pathway protein A
VILFSMKTPFVISPSPTLLYLTPSFKKATHMITATLDNRQGVSCIIGDIGMGKSSLLRYLHAEYLSRDECVAVLIPGGDTFKRPFAVLRRICTELGLEPCRSMLDYQMALEKYLLEVNGQGRYVAVFFDEAERLDTYMLDMIRGLLNYEKSETGKLIQFVMAGSLELYDRLRRKRNRALRSRVLYMNFLEPFSLDETRGMIEFRCDRLDVPNPFTRSALEKIHELSHGVPRRILAVASAGYDLRAMADTDRLDADFVEECYHMNDKPENAEIAYG